MQGINPPEKEFFQSLKSDTLIEECGSFMVRSGLQSMDRLSVSGDNTAQGTRRFDGVSRDVKHQQEALLLIQDCSSHTHADLERRSSHPAHDTPAAVSEQPYPLYLCGKQTARTPPHFEIIMVKSPLAGR